MGMIKGRKNKKPVRLRRLFIRYLSMFCAAALLLGLFLLGAFWLLMSMGGILPANSSEKQLTAAMDAIRSREIITPDIIPDLCQYAVYTPSGEMTSGNLKPVEAKKAWALTQEDGSGQDYLDFYVRIARTNDICIVRYTMISQFNSPLLRNILPSPVTFTFLLFIFGFIVEIFLFATSFGKMLTRKMRGLQNATDKIQHQDLEFVVESSGVVEIDGVLSSIDKMKEALKTSLKNEWKLEQERREQISALAHDVKTPLTIVRGNAELLAETPLTEEQTQYINFIIDNASRMESYIRTLIEVSQSETGVAIRKVNIDCNDFAEELCSGIRALASIKGLHSEFHLDSLPTVLSADPSLLRRAVMNIVSNAVDFSPSGGKITFSARASDNRIQFCIADTGNGFSPEELARASERFFMGDASRSAKAHYGLGLYISRSIAELHHGSLFIDNDTCSGGGRVTIEVPIN